MSKIMDLLEPLAPKNFDKNELFVLSILVLVWTLLYLLQKSERVLLKSEVIALLVFNAWFGTLGDRLLAEKPLDLYDTLDYPYGEFFDSVLQVGVYPVPVVIAIYFYRKHQMNKWLTIFIWALILTYLEWVSNKYFDVFHFKKWMTFYSFFFYAFAVKLNISLFNHIISRRNS
ncbi:CBO0543 family protein [Robertmurraya massiliosenegalensis]|uniref:CBO0543 family protein n=1 Tax=Robertmurraya massiliosenegalensis TaxID=1287657 RepID=UPI00035F6AE6|nr:CBO0543 family protein [Robertmurraya massiliosenegalensis]